MLIEFFFALRRAGLKVSITELLTLLEALQARLIAPNVNAFYSLARLILVKNETEYDRFDRAFGAYFRGAEAAFDKVAGAVPEDWLRRQAERWLSEAEKRQIETLGGWQQLMNTLRRRLSEQRERHQGGSKWIGTAGTSPFGAYGYNPEGVRIGQSASRHRRAVKVWDRRGFRNFDEDAALEVRNIKLALRRLRRFAREGAAEVLDLEGTIKRTAGNGGRLNLQMVPERRNAVKVLLLLDTGGSMDDHIGICEALFTAARGEFRRLRSFYFHNCVYEELWRDNRRRGATRMPTLDLIRTHGADHKLIVVGDATMSPYEIIYPGGSVEHWNEEPGARWLERLLAHFPDAIWLNPRAGERWSATPSIRLVRELMQDRMFPLTLHGLEEGMRLLAR